MTLNSIKKWTELCEKKHSMSTLLDLKGEVAMKVYNYYTDLGKNETIASHYWRKHSKKNSTMEYSKRLATVSE